MTVFNNIIDFIFICDLILAFRITFENKMTGEEQFIPKDIAINYLKGARFYIDLVSCIPFDLLLIGQEEADSHDFLRSL